MGNTKIRVSTERTFKKRVLENLMTTHRNLATKPLISLYDTKALIVLTKFILRMTKNLDDESFDL